MPQRIKVVACGVFEHELQAAAQQSDNQVVIQCLDAGLHARPDELRRRAQEAIDQAEMEPYDAVAFCYGLCGRGVIGLRAKSKPLVIPRAHDCIALFLGSRREYRRQFAQHPGTYYITPGWYEKKAHPAVNPFKDDPDAGRQHPKFAEYAERYGEANAEYLVRFFDSWKKNYTRAAFIDVGMGDTATYERYTGDLAKELGWDFERLQGSLRLIQGLVAGDWPASDFLVVPPGQRIVATGKDDLFQAVPIEAAPHAPTSADEVKVVGPPHTGPRPPARLPRLGLGIDAGGTYTDSVLYSFDAGRTLDKAKALTTPHRFADGIVASVRQLDASRFPDVDIVCLSTTLATNAIVEGRGGRVGLLLLPHDRRAAERINVHPVAVLKGRIDITGKETEPLDAAQARRAIVRFIERERVDAIAISGYGGTLNPKHELALKQWVADAAADLGVDAPPVVCGHELSSKLDFIKRAHTAALNAKLLPMIQGLIDSVKAALGELGIDAQIMVVKGDGTLVSEAVARQRPIDTILSGPAASAAGAVFLTGQQHAVVIDMGGTTTDTALIAGGRVAVHPDGAQVGPWRTSVDAVDMLTTGLGGDSALGLDRDGNLTVGPQRVVPLACLAAQWPAVREQLQRLLDAAEHTDHTLESLDFFSLVQADGRSRLDDRERDIMSALADGPRSRLDLSQELGYMAPSLLRTNRLEALGCVRRAALTPTDVLHVDGDYCAWDAAAAAIALDVFAGIWQRPREQAAASIRREVVRRLAMEIIRRYVSLSADAAELETSSVCRLLLDNLFDGRRRAEFAFRFDVARPVVAIGAPVGAFMPAVGEHLSAQVIIPEHADVANAIGAITSKVVVSESATIRPSDVGDYIVHTSSEKREFERLGDARRYAEHTVAESLRVKAPMYGTDETAIDVRTHEREGKLSTGELVFLEMRVEGRLEGRPVLVA